MSIHHPNPSSVAGAADLSWIGIDMPPASPHAEDEEFATTDGFGWVNQGAAVATYPHHSLMIETPTSATTSLRLRTKAMGAPTGDYKYRCKAHLSIPSVVSMYGGLAIREAGTGKIVVITIGRETSLVYMGAFRYTSATSAATLIGSVITLSTQHNVCLLDWILEVEKVSSNLFYRFLPAGGGQAVQIATEAATASFTTRPDEWGVFANAVNASNKCFAVFPWARRIS